MSPIQKITIRVRAFIDARAGSVGILCALTIIPLILAAGAAVDFTRANKERETLDAIADSAALAAVNQHAMSLSLTQAQTEAINVFNAQAASQSHANNLQVSATVSASGPVRNSVVQYTASVPTAFMGLAGYNSLNIGGQSKASSGIPTYIDFYLLLDNTPSMGVGASPSDVNTMVSNTPDRCAFACHDVSNPNNYYNLAKSLGVTMRIDVVRNAAQQLMDTAASIETVSDQYRVAFYTFGPSASQAGLTSVVALTPDLVSAKNAASSIDLMSVNGQNQNSDQDTNFDQILPQMDNAITAPGDGSSSSSPQKVLFFVSDGVADEQNASCSKPTIAGRCQEPINVSLCTAIKNRGIKIAVLYTTYLALPTNSWYNTWIAPFNAGPYGPSVNSEIAADMQSCASPGLYFEVSPTDGIAEAMAALFQRAVAQARLTQ